MTTFYAALASYHPTDGRGWYSASRGRCTASSVAFMPHAFLRFRRASAPAGRFVSSTGFPSAGVR